MMANGFANSLGAWQPFFMLAGASAATLIGLLFVVVLLGAGRSGDRAREEMTVFLTPVVVHFAIVLIIAALCLCPIRDRTVLGVLLLPPAATGMANTLTTSARFLRISRRQRWGVDAWVARIVVPAFCFVVLLGSAIELVLSNCSNALPAVAGVVVILLLAGVRNSWSAVIELAGGEARPEDSAEPAAERRGEDRHNGLSYKTDHDLILLELRLSS